MLVRISDREDPDQTSSSEAVWSGSGLFVQAFLAGILCSKFQNIYRNAFISNFCLNHAQIKCSLTNQSK